MKHKRDTAIDILKGIAIILVIIGHWLTDDSIFHTYIYSFHPHYPPLWSFILGTYKHPNTLQPTRHPTHRRVTTTAHHQPTHTLLSHTNYTQDPMGPCLIQHLHPKHLITTPIVCIYIMYPKLPM